MIHTTDGYTTVIIVVVVICHIIIICCCTLRCNERLNRIHLRPRWCIGKSSSGGGTSSDDGSFTLFDMMVYDCFTILCFINLRRMLSVWSRVTGAEIRHDVSADIKDGIGLFYIIEWRL